MTSEAANDTSPVWTPDGQQVVFTSDRDGGLGFFRKSADGTGEVEHLATIDGATRLWAYGWSPDENSLVFDMVRSGSGVDIGVLSMEGERSWVPLLESEANEVGPAISPDGQWIAYLSPDTRRREVYVQRFPDLGERQQISTKGGIDPTWSPGGQALFSFLGYAAVVFHRMRWRSSPSTRGHPSPWGTRKCCSTMRPIDAIRVMGACMTSPRTASGS